ncbi:hypothetical protein KJ951_01110 [Patescibacteria group bacterium]|nr:hypothetical protein [Patescibacteria group bacterium]MBU1702979.1 hypothetical protein [Patescibacteria group bacterium]
MGKVSIETSYLYANPSFIGGMAKVLDMGGTLVVYNESSTPVVADIKAMSNDWKAVGKDLAYSIQNYGQEQK